jgi:uncharacterized protein (DUF924 family)
VVTRQADSILRFWFGAPTAAVLPGPETRSRWFRGGASFDDECAREYGRLLEEALGGGLGEWLEAPRASLALVLLLDQIPRNVHRGTARAFAGDARALEIASARVDAGDDAGLNPVERYFLYMPFEHAEDRAAQERSVGLFRSLADAVPSDGDGFFAGGVQWAERHRDVVHRFGRFPSRNTALGRQTTSEEAAFLADHPAGF